VGAYQLLFDASRLAAAPRVMEPFARVDPTTVGALQALARAVVDDLQHADSTPTP
jgi:hypothetical protein